MAKDRHRIFEIYPSQDEAISELLPKARNAGNSLPVPELGSFEQLIVSQSAGITQVQYKEPAILAQDILTQVQKDFMQLADKLTGDSRVLIDFTGVESFGPAGITALTLFEKRLKVRGSRMVLCSLDTNVRASFFATP